MHRTLNVAAWTVVGLLAGTLIIHRQTIHERNADVGPVFMLLERMPGLVGLVLARWDTPGDTSLNAPLIGLRLRTAFAGALLALTICSLTLIFPLPAGPPYSIDIPLPMRSGSRATGSFRAAGTFNYFVDVQLNNGTLTAPLKKFLWEWELARSSGKSHPPPSVTWSVKSVPAARVNVIHGSFYPDAHRPTLQFGTFKAIAEHKYTVSATVDASAPEVQAPNAHLMVGPGPERVLWYLTGAAPGVVIGPPAFVGALCLWLRARRIYRSECGNTRADNFWRMNIPR